jgi:hypothetical protein
MTDRIIAWSLQEFLQEVAEKMADRKAFFDDIFVHQTRIWDDNASMPGLVYKTPLNRPIWVCMNGLTPSLYIQK